MNWKNSLHHIRITEASKTIAKAIVFKHDSFSFFLPSHLPSSTLASRNLVSGASLACIGFPFAPQNKFQDCSFFCLVHINIFNRRHTAQRATRCSDCSHRNTITFIKQYHSFSSETFFFLQKHYHFFLLSLSKCSIFEKISFKSRSYCYLIWYFLSLIRWVESSNIGYESYWCTWK